MNPASQPTDEWLALPEEERERTFQAKPLWQRALIVAAGPVTNFLIAIVILAGFNFAYGIVETPAVVTELEESGPAYSSGIELGDKIIALDGVETPTFEDLRRRVIQFPGQQVAVELVRDGETMVIPVRLATIEEHDRFGNYYSYGRLGTGFTRREIRDVGAGEAVVLAFRQTGQIVDMMVTGIKQVITGQRSIKELGGPLKIAKLSGEQLSMGWLQFVNFVAMISINLAFINLLPIPVLDGGHLAFYAAEAVRRKPVSPRSQEWAFRTGLAFVLALMLFVTINDIVSLPIFSS